VVDLEKEMEKLFSESGGKKRPEADETGNVKEKSRAADNRAGWINGASRVAIRVDLQHGERGRPFRGRPYRG